MNEVVYPIKSVANIACKGLELIAEMKEVCKFILCVLLTQFGKTFTTIGRITEEIERDKEYGRSIHLVWTMNTLLNNTQFANRLNTIEKIYGHGSVVIFASKYNGLYKHIKNLNELNGLVLDNHTCPRVIVMCSNDIRYTDGFRFINILNSNTTNIQRVFAYYDELHKYINMTLTEPIGSITTLRGIIEEIDSMDIVKGIMAMTATPKDILQKEGYWSRIRMIQLDDFNSTNYSGVIDMDFNTVDDFFPEDYKRPGPFDFDKHDTETLGFINHVLDKYPDILGFKQQVFIPGHIRRISHQAIRTEVFKRCPTAVVVILNGEEKTLEYYVGKDKKTVSLISPTEEVCKTVARVVGEKDLIDRCLVYTGYLCVGMGQTLIEESLGPFTAAILSHLSLTNDEIYQLFGRCTARSKNWLTYVPTDIYCPTKIMRRVEAMEICARNLATQHNGEFVTEAMYDAPLYEIGDVGEAALENVRVKKEKVVKPKKPSAVQHSVGFKTIEEVNAFLSGIFKKPIHVASFIGDEQVAGYTLSTRLNTYYHKTRSELKAEDRLTKEFFDNIKVGMNISKTQGSGQPYMVYPVYPTLDSTKDDFLYYVRYLPPQPTTSA